MVWITASGQHRSFASRSASTPLLRQALQTSPSLYAVRIVAVHRDDQTPLERVEAADSAGGQFGKDLRWCFRQFRPVWKTVR